MLFILCFLMIKLHSIKSPGDARSQAVDRCRPQPGRLWAITPRDEQWLFVRERRVCGPEKLILQGMDLNNYSFSGLGDRDLADLAGSMSNGVCVAAMVVALFATVEWQWSNCREIL